MRFKSVSIAAITIFLLLSVLIVPGISFDDSFLVLNEYSDAILQSSYSIDDMNIEYYIHQFNGIIIKNDYVLVHTTVDSDEIIKIESKWSEIPDKIEMNQPIKPEIDNEYFWMEPVLFIEENDLENIYQLYATEKFPLMVWETRHTDGTTILYDEDGNRIGMGLPTPWKGFSLSGFHEPGWPDPWLDFRLNADQWYQKWCDQTVSMSTPTPTTISSYVSNEEYHLFYELAHGAETYFQADTTGSYYTSTMTETDMEFREKYRLAFIGSCHGMTTTDEGTFSYAFRKGSMTDTVTIGYDHMEECPGWSDALEWQDFMFYAMDNGYTIKDAFDAATAEYPAIAPAVVFVGDETITIFEDNGGDDPNIIPPHVFITYPSDGFRTDQPSLTVTGTADDLDGKVDHVYVKLDDNSWQEASGTSNWEYTFDLQTCCDPGSHLITAVAVDDDNIQSGCVYKEFFYGTDSLDVSITAPDEATVGDVVLFDFEILNEYVDPVLVEWDFDDGTSSNESAHIFNNPGGYTVEVSVTDALMRSGSADHFIQIKDVDRLPPKIQVIKPSSSLIINDIVVLPWITPVMIGSCTLELDITDESGLKETIVTFQGSEYIADPVDCTNPSWMLTNTCFGKETVIITSVDLWGNTNEYTMNIWKFF